jgi:hypothetical protein
VKGFRLDCAESSGSAVSVLLQAYAYFTRTYLSLFCVIPFGLHKNYMTPAHVQFILGLKTVEIGRHWKGA